ncbi:hypothetical protein WA026_000518 [Henosepilachna vigintioctopunctata]|uniref:Uncharacterized protein n=1 Tax=Henosepilachna vigintioctopunctata TaxID=420089 RepID=A0AAW1V4E7_9CUCU
MDPPPCIQNAMMTKDKKPFTYTPGGINLSEIRSPRMARRIERNAAYEGVGTPPPSQNRPQFPQGSLPPSALAAMQPQMHVQVFPSGPPPPPPMNNMRGGIPPPPPSSSYGAPPPPPPPSQPLPTQKIRTGDHQEVERPDMTKIIPENPMRLLRKTAGPKIKNTLLDELYRGPANVAQHQPQMSADPRSPPIVNSPPISNPSFERQTKPAPAQIVQPQQKQPSYQPQSTPPVQQQTIQQQRSPPVIERNEPPRNTWQQPQKSPIVQTPGTPTLKEAPKPWQQKQQLKQDEVPEWAKREPNLPQSPVAQEVPVNQPNKQQQQPRWPQNSQPSSGATPYKEPEQVYRKPQPNTMYVAPQQSVEQPQRFQQYPEYQPNSETHPNAVFVTQPVVLQHPGSGYGPPMINRRENITVSKQEGGARVIPIRVEGAESPIQNRQPTWSNNSPQSGSTRPIQKMTSNEVGGLPDRRLPQQHPHEEMRKMQLNNSDQDLLNRFKQVPSDVGRNQPHVRNIPIQIEGNGAPSSQCYIPPSQQTPAEEPKKYTGSSIPSRSFKMLQAMTAHDSCANAKEANRTNYDFPYCGGNWAYPPPAYPVCPLPPFWPPYFHPLNHHEYATTERSDSDPDINKPELKKYPPPFWGFSASSTPTQELDSKSGRNRRASLPFSASSSTSEMETLNGRRTPLPNWGNSGRTTPVPGIKTPKNYSDSEHGSNRTTPIPFWGGYPQARDASQLSENNQDGFSFYPMYPPYYDPYYMSYYYGYPPIFPPAPHVYQPSEPEDMNGYSSMDEMSFYNQKMPHSNFESEKPESPISTPVIVVTPTPKEFEDAGTRELLTSDSDTDTEVNEEIIKRPGSTGALQTIRSVKDINVYRQYEQDSEQSDDEIEEVDDSESSSDSSVFEGEETDEVVPHQLSIIFEVSERTDISRNARASSITSDCTTVGAKSDDENDDDNVPANKEWISDNLMEIAFRIQSRINARIELDDMGMSSISSSEHSKQDFIYPVEDINNHCQSPEDFLTESSRIQDIIKITDPTKHCLIETKNIDEYKFSNELKSKLENVLNENEKQNREETTVNDENLDSDENDKCSKDFGDVNEITCDKLEVVDNSKESSDSEDWWGVIGNKEDDFVPRKSYSYNRDSTYYGESQVDNTENTDSEVKPLANSEINEVLQKNEEVDMEEKTMSVEEQVPFSNEDECINKQREDSAERDAPLGTTSAHSSDSSADLRKEVSNADSAPELESDNTSSSESEESEDSSNEDEEEIKHDLNNNEQEDEEEPVVQVPTIKDRIKALQESISAKRKTLRVDEEIKICVKSQVLATELGEASRSKTISAKSSVNSFDEISEEDSGVTDMSRQFSDSEEFPELRKMTRYQRASTHSRLFQLLQGEGDEDEELPMEERKGQLTLPLVSDELADELVHSMLKQRKGQIFRNMSMEKLHAAAKRILQEDSSMDNLPDTPSEGFSEFLSPLRNDTGNSTPQEFYGHYNEYLQYYDSWAQASATQDVPHKSPRPFATGLAKCPRVLSGKNVHSDMMRLAATPEEPSLLPETKS